MVKTAPIFRPLCVAAAAISLAACAENESSVTLEGVLVPSSSDCTVTPSGDALRLLRGSLDLAFRTRYDATLLVGNQLTPRGNKAQLRTETQSINLEGAEVRVTLDGRVVDEFSVEFGGFVKPASGPQPGYGAAHVTLVPDRVGTSTRVLDAVTKDGSATLVAYSRVFGTTLGGVPVTSSEFSFAIDVCYGCSIVFPLDAIDDSPEGPVCSDVGGAFQEDAPCQLGQDSAVDCRFCAAALDVCRYAP